MSGSGTSTSILGRFNDVNQALWTGLPLQESQDPRDVYYTTSEPAQPIAYLEDAISGVDVYEVDSLVRQINDEVRFPKQRVPRDLYLKIMRQINAYLPLCTNEKRGHEFKHKRIRIDRSMKQKLAGKAKDILTSECIYCSQHWSGLRYPLEEDPKYPEGMSIFRHARHSTKSAKPSIATLSRLSSINKVV